MREITEQAAIMLLLYSGKDREGTIRNLKNVREDLTADEQELMKLTDDLLEKLRPMSEAEFRDFLRLAEDIV